MACRLAFRCRRFSLMLSRICIPHEFQAAVMAWSVLGTSYSNLFFSIYVISWHLFLHCPCSVFCRAIQVFLNSVTWTCILTILYINDAKPLWFAYLSGELKGKGVCVSRSLWVPWASSVLHTWNCAVAPVRAADGDEQDAVSGRRAPCSKFSCVFISQKHSGLLWNRVSLISSLQLIVFSVWCELVSWGGWRPGVKRWKWEIC